MLSYTTSKCITTVAISSLLCFSSFASFDAVQTTRLKSTAGAGVGSILMDESTVLNPAPIAFYNISSLYYQRTGSDFQSSDSADPFQNNDAKTNAFVVSDAKAGKAGSASYFGRKRGLNEQQRYSLSGAAVVGDRSALGVNYTISKTRFLEGGLDQEKQTSKYWNIGITHIVSPTFTLGLVAVDPLRSTDNETRAIVGGQYVFGDFISLIMDVGANYREDLSNTLVTRGAAQFKIFSDFFLRVGAFRDRGLAQKGNGIGVGWVQPRLVLDLSFNNTKTNSESELLFVEDKVKETSFSISYRF
jgi:hypothetical protein